jgi:hypothetical protein
MKAFDFNRWPGGLLYIGFLALYAIVYATAGKYVHAISDFVPVGFLYAVSLFLTGAGSLLVGYGIRTSRNIFLWLGLACGTLAGLIFVGLHFNVFQNPTMQVMP